MSDSSQTPAPKPQISLDPANTVQGAMERLMLAEAFQPGDPHYDANTNLEQMRKIRQVIANRKENSAQYDAHGAKTEIDIIKANNPSFEQFKVFSSYPNVSPLIEERWERSVSIANDPRQRQQAAYAQHVQDVIRAANESVAHPVSKYPDATGWRRSGTGGDGPGFVPLGSIGSNTFFRTRTLVEHAQHHARQARKDAGSKPVPAHMQLHHAIMKLIGHQSSYAPIRAPKSGTAGNAARTEAGSSSVAQVAGASQQNAADDVPHSGSVAIGAGEWSRIACQIAASVTGLAPGFRQQMKNNPILQAAKIGASTIQAFAPVLRPALPSIAPRMPSSSSYAGPRASRQNELAPGFHGVGGQTSESAALANRLVENAASAGQAEESAAAYAATQQHVKLALSDYFDQQARLPPSAGAAFDPRLTPAWSGLKLPG
jgi:hypothetical protein